MIGAITVLYDRECGFCCRAARWLQTQRRNVRIECVPMDSTYVQMLFPDLRKLPKAELTVVDDQGGVYYGTNAWILTLWATESGRPWSARLARPALKPLAREAFELVSTNRKLLSSLFGLRSDAAVAEAVHATIDPAHHARCGETGCTHEPGERESLAGARTRRNYSPPP